MNQIILLLNQVFRPFICCFVCETLRFQSPFVPWPVVFARVSFIGVWVEADKEDTS